jgi:hypothetical protein
VHRWQRLKAAEGGWYKKCRSCEMFKDIPDRGPVGGFF